MARLIDEEVALQQFIKETETSGKNVIHINTLKRLLQDIDTAYDVDKVVAELEKKDDDCGCGKITVFDAIDIVRKGGVE